MKESNTEIAELRSMIHPASETQEKERLKVQFPYSAKSRAVIVGGHETWAKAIKPLLKNVSRKRNAGEGTAESSVSVFS